MKTATIEITGVIATSGRYNRIQFDVLDSKGNKLTVIYPQSRRGEDDDSLAVDASVFQVAMMIFATDSKQGVAQLYVNRACCCCSDTKIAVEGIYSLALPPP
ncbi:MAG: hypothetical protein AB1Z98_17095 [Nannocystaceae bacterium]